MKRKSSAHMASAQTGQAPWRTACWAVLCGVVAATIVFAPAAWLARGLHAVTDGRLLLADAQGSVWHGSAQLLLTGGEGAQDAVSLPGRLDWTLRPSWLGLQMALHMPCCTAEPVQLAFQPGWGQSTAGVLPAKIYLPAQWLTGLGAPWNTLDPQGQLALSSQALQIQWSQGRMRMEGQLTLDMMAMSSRLSTLSPLGDYRLMLSGGNVPTLSLQTLQGALKLSGSGQVVGSRIRFSGEASTSAEQLDALSNVLNIIGRRQGSKSLISLG